MDDNKDDAIHSAQQPSTVLPLDASQWNFLGNNEEKSSDSTIENEPPFNETRSAPPQGTSKKSILPKLKIQTRSDRKFTSDAAGKLFMADFSSYQMFTPLPKNDQLSSFPSITNLEDLSETKEQSGVSEQKLITTDEIIKRYYPTTLCSALFLRTLRFIRMACIVLPIISMFGSLFTHTSYVERSVETTAKLWALALNVEATSSLADTLSGISIGIISFIAMACLLYFFWLRFIKKKFLVSSRVGLNNVRAEVIKLLTSQNDLIDELKEMGILEDVDATDINNNVGLISNDSESTASFSQLDCYTPFDILSFKYLTLMQCYNNDRMGPYDIARERLANQFKVFAIFSLVQGIYKRHYSDKKEDKKNKFKGKRINHEKIYIILLGALAYAKESSINDHQKSECFSWLKKYITQSHYALMLERLINDEIQNDNDDHIKAYNEFINEVSSFEPVFIRAQAESGYVEGYADRIRLSSR
jgi:hypothetical protein